MGNSEKIYVAIGTVTGPFFNEEMVCQNKAKIRPLSGLMMGENPFDYSFPLLLVQISLIFLITRLIYYFLKPLRQSILTAQVLAGLLLGPSFLRHYFPTIVRIFPPGGRTILNVIGDVGLIFHIFVLSLQMNTNIIKQAGTSETLIGITGFLLPAIMGWLTLSTFTKSPSEGDPPPLIKGGLFIIVLNSVSSFPVISSHLADLKLLNSDIGRLASKVCMISDICCFVLSQFLMAMSAFAHESYEVALRLLISVSLLVFTIVYIIRPFIIWLTTARYLKRGQTTMDEVHFFMIITLVLICALGSEVLGQHFIFGPFLLGMVLPDGPPLGTEMENKLHSINNGLLIPVFCAFSGLSMNTFDSHLEGTYWLLKLIVFVTYIAKFIGIFFPSLCCGVSFWDSVYLALLLSCKGIIELAWYVKWMDSKIVDTHFFNFLLITLMLVTGIARGMVAFLYDPSKRYRTSNRRTFQGSNYHLQLRILVCIHNEDNVPLIINLLKACDPTRYNPITVFVLQLRKLSGHASAVLAPHHKLEKLKTPGNNSVHIVNAFQRLEQQYKGSILVQHYTAIAPYKSMHSDICTIALDKRTTIVILPFHKTWGIHGNVGLVNSSIKNVNKKVMELAPCSVGILIDKDIGMNQTVLTSYSFYHIAVLFFGGDDDCEATAVSLRMAGHQHVELTIILFKHEDCCYDDNENNIEYLLETFASEECRERVKFEKVVVKNAEDTVKILNALGDAFDLTIVGRHYDPYSPIIMGLTEWKEGKNDLGVIGDILSSSDFKFSVLVVVQQYCLRREFKSSSSSKSLESKSSSNYSKEDEYQPIIKH